MKTIKIILSSMLILIGFTTSLVGCGSPDNSAEPINIAFVVGIADDETKLNDGIAELTNLPAQPGTDYAFVSIEGEPSTIGEPGTIPDLSEKGYTDVMMERVRSSIKADLTEKLTSYTWLKLLYINLTSKHLWHWFPRK